MKKSALLLTLTTVASAAMAANETGYVPESKDTTKVIDIEEVVVIATPKENNRLRQQALSSTSFSQNEMRNNAVTSIKSISGLVPNLSLIHI